MPKPVVIRTDEWTPDDADELFGKTLGQLVDELPEGVSLRIYVRPDHKGLPYVMIHAVGWGAVDLEKVLIDAGIIKTEPVAKIAETADA